MSKYILIPDSFKGTLSSREVCQIVAEAIRSQEPEAEICAIPVADGGEGTVDAFLSAVGGQQVPVACTGPYGEAITACYGLLPDGSAVVEMAGYLTMTLIASFLLRWLEKRMDGSSDYKLAQTDHLTMAAGTYSHPDRGTPFDERSKEYRDRVRQELQHGRTRGDR